MPRRVDTVQRVPGARTRRTLSVSASTPTVERPSRLVRSARAVTRSGTTSCSAPKQARPGDGRGRSLLAHELTHVLQQTGGASTAPASAR